MNMNNMNSPITPRSKFLEYKSLVQDDASFSRRYFVPPNPKLSGNNGVPINLRYHTDNVTDVRWVSDFECLTCSIDSTLCKWNLVEASEADNENGAGSSYPNSPTAVSSPDSAAYFGAGGGGLSPENNNSNPLVGGTMASLGTNNNQQTSNSAAAQINLVPVKTVSDASAEGVYCVDVMGKTIATGSSGKQLKLYGLDELDSLASLDTESAVYAVRFRDPQFLVCGTKLGCCMFFDPASEACISQIEGLHKSVLQSVDLSENNGVLTGGSDGKIYLVDPRAQNWSPANFSYVAVEKTAIYAVRWCANPNYFLSSGDNYCISRWDVRKMSTLSRRRGEQSVVTNYFGHSSDVRCLEMLGEDYFVSGTADGSLRIWPVDEVGAIQDTLVQNDFQIEKAESDRAEIEVNVVAHAHSEPGRKKVQKNLELLHDLYDRTFELQEIYSERSALQCLQATYQLDAHSSLVCGLSARKCPQSNHWRILTSSADQTVKLFRLANKLDKNRHVRWVTQYSSTPAYDNFGFRDTMGRHDSLTRVY
ncbi:unnamed protein product [Amoebophrya sp. A120]|nr:unnamed protein product [Amoebophrya sp. A120]|eukprot:GSA120T00025420001.1